MALGEYRIGAPFIPADCGWTVDLSTDQEWRMVPGYAEVERRWFMVKDGVTHVKVERMPRDEYLRMVNKDGR